MWKSKSVRAFATGAVIASGEHFSQVFHGTPIAGVGSILPIIRLTVQATRGK